MPDSLVQQMLTAAVQHHNARRLAEAEQIYRQVLATYPDQPDALHLLGLLRRQSGDNAAAIELIQRSLSIHPACENANFNLGNALRDQGQHDEARQAFARSIALHQNVAQSRHNTALLDRDLSLKFYRRGNAFGQQRRFSEAIDAFDRAIALRAEFAEAYCNRGNALVELNRLDEAIASYRKSVAINPEFPEAHHNLGKAFYDQGLLDESIAANERALALRPAYASAARNLAHSLFEAGRLDESLAISREAIANHARTAPAEHSDLIYKLHFHPDSTASSIAEETALWNRVYAEPSAGPQPPHLNDPTVHRRLKIGYVSPDFRQHVVGDNLKPLFKHHDHARFEVFCYANVSRPDVATRWFEKHADVWRNAIGQTDEQLAEQIRGDGIDILVDLALHTPDNRLLTFARKPAPVQVSFAGYPGTTGLTAIDYRLSDRFLEIPGGNQIGCSGEAICLPHSFWCFDPSDCADLPVSALPARATAAITFGCLNNFCKLNSGTMSMWASVMRQVPGSRLLLLTKQGKHRETSLNFFSDCGIDRGRVEFVSYSPRREYLQRYHRIDIGLDTFPYNGHTTSLDASWMGVPVVSLVGRTIVSRAGFSQLSNLGLNDLVAQTPEHFEKIAVDLAKDWPRLEQLRAGLRTRMEQSPLMNAAAFASGIETAYREMWRRWCELEPRRRI